MKFTVIFLLIAMFSTSIIGTAHAIGNGLTVGTFTTTPFIDPSTLTNMEPLGTGSSKVVCDGTIRIGHGTLRKYDYVGPLGTGTLYLETLHSKTQLTTPYDTSIGIGGGVYRYTLEITTDGGFGTGILKGIGKLQWDYNLPAFQYEQWDTAKMVPVEGDLNLKWVTVEGYMFLFSWWWTTTTVVS